jgi:hypothetical protein
MTHDLRSKITDEGYRPTEVIVLLSLLRGPSLKYSAPGIFHNLDLCGYWVGDVGTRQKNPKV